VGAGWSGKSSGPGSKGKSSGSSSKGSPGTGSSGGGNATEILKTTSDHPVITVDLPVTSQSEAVVGPAVTVHIHADRQRQGHRGRLRRGQLEQQPQQRQRQQRQRREQRKQRELGLKRDRAVTIALAPPVGGAGLDQAAVSVRFVQAKTTKVRSVRVIAAFGDLGVEPRGPGGRAA
jgi:hypothetical protein